MHLPAVACAALSTLALLPALGACIDVGDRPEPVRADAVIAGRITVQTATGFARGPDAEAVRAARRSLADASSTSGAAPSTVPTPTGRLPRASAATDAEVPQASSTKDAPQWQPGGALVLFEDGAYTQETLEPALRQMLASAALGDVTAQVIRCTAERWCKAELRRAGTLLSSDATADAVLGLNKHLAPKVKVVARNMLKRGLRVPNDPSFGFQWHHDFIHAPAAWDITVGDPDLVIAVIDSGIVQAHPDVNDRLARDPLNNVVLGVDLISGNFDGDAFPGRDTDPEDTGDGALPGGGSTFHGTHIAGVIGAETNNGEGVAGITWDGQILPVRVLGRGLQGYDDDIMDGIYWAIGETVAGVPPPVKKARVINLSLGGPAVPESRVFWEENFAAIFADAQNKYGNPIFIAAAGNSDDNAANILPAAVPGMITVGASGIAGTRAAYSNYGAVIDIMAPGGNGDTDLNSDGYPDKILSLVGGGYDFREGTSMAAPHVTGVAALLVSVNPALTQAQVESILTSSANIGGVCSEGCGAGWLDAVNALLVAGGQVQTRPKLAADKLQVFVPQGFQTVSLRVLNLGNSPLSFQGTVEGAQASLFNVTPLAGTLREASAGIELSASTVTISLERGAFKAGSATLKLVTTDIDPPQQVDIPLSFDDDENRRPRELQLVEVSAWRERSNGDLERVASTLARRADGFAYELKDLRPGSYYVFAVGDDNLDGRFQAELESFGAWPRVDTREPVTLAETERRADIDITVDAAFALQVEGTVGSPCTNDGACTFLPDAACIDTFASGYCSRICDDGACGPNGACAELDCGGEACKVCLARCTSDSQCRFSEGYVCDLGACVPADFALER